VKPERLKLPLGFHYRRRGGPDRFAGGQTWHIAAGGVGDVVVHALCGKGLTGGGFHAFDNGAVAAFMAQNKAERWRGYSHGVCDKCRGVLRTRRVPQAGFDASHVLPVLEIVLSYLQVLNARGEPIRFDPKVVYSVETVEEIAKRLGEALAFDAVLRDAEVGAVLRKAVERGRKLHKWQGSAHMLDAIKAEVAELEEAHGKGHAEDAAGEALDVAVCAWRYYDGQ